MTAMTPSVTCERRFTAWAGASPRAPVALGFGISSPEQARAYAEMTDAVVVGSFIVSTFHKHGNTPAGRDAATAEVAALIQAVKGIGA